MNCLTCHSVTKQTAPKSAKAMPIYLSFCSRPPKKTKSTRGSARIASSARLGHSLLEWATARSDSSRRILSLTRPRAFFSAREIRKERRRWQRRLGRQSVPHFALLGDTRPANTNKGCCAIAPNFGRVPKSERNDVAAKTGKVSRALKFVSLWVCERKASLWPWERMRLNRSGFFRSDSCFERKQPYVINNLKKLILKF